MGFSLGEHVDISQVLALKERLQLELTQSDSMLIDGSEVTRVDAPGLQLILAIKTACHQQSVAWQWEAASEQLVGAASVLGLKELLELDSFSK